ncbi:tetratricopeptide repeat protein [bacterium]|nr:tetratricopeptide repeat protein [bacterium]
MYTEAQLLQQIADARKNGTAVQPRVLHACQNLADWYVSVGRLNDAEQRWANLIKELDGLPDAKLADRAVAHVRRAEVLHALGQLQAEQTELWTAIEILHQEPQPPRLDLAYILNQLAEVTYALGRYETALTASQQALAWLTDVVPTSHHEMVRTRNNLAATHVVRGEFALAERLLRQNLKLLARQYGEQDAGLVIPLQNLAEVLRATGKLTEAEKVLQTAEQIATRRFGSAHAITLHGLMLKADLLVFQGDLSTAERLLRQVLETRQATAPDDRVPMARTLLELGQILCQRSRYREAEPVLDAALQLVLTLHGETHPKTSAVYVALSRLYLGLGRLANAERSIQKALGIQQLALHPQATAHAETHRQHAIIAATRGDWATAQAAIQRALDQIERTDAGAAELPFQVFLTAADLALQTGNIDTADQHLARADAMRTSPQISLRSRLTFRRLRALVALKQNDLTAAATACERAFAILQALPTHPPEEAAQLAAVAADVALLQQDFATCLSLCEQERVFRQLLGQGEALSVANLYFRQAQALQQQQAFAPAVTAFQQALAIAERSYQAPAGFVQEIVERLARLHLLQRDFQAFRPWMQRVLSLWNASDETPDTTICEDWIPVLRNAGEAVTADELTDQLVLLQNRQSHVLGDLL